jgi:hypothetical protein
MTIDFNKERAAFETKFPVPLNPTKYGIIVMKQHSDRWEGWQACSAQVEQEPVLIQALDVSANSIEPDAWVEIGVISLQTYIDEGWKVRKLYTSPRSTSDDARDAARWRFSAASCVTGSPEETMMVQIGNNWPDDDEPRSAQEFTRFIDACMDAIKSGK